MFEKPQYIITGDKHGQYDIMDYLCDTCGTTLQDVLIILGDAGINYYGDSRDNRLKDYLAKYPVTIFSIHGNHERRPSTIATYKETMWKGGIVYYEEDYPNLLFAKDGEIYDFDGKKVLVLGGAYSVDKWHRLAMGYHWFEDEQPSQEIKDYVEAQLEKVGWKVDVVLSHTAPLKYEPTEVFLRGIDQSKVDKSTEIWLDKIEDKLDYKKWYCGHYHTEKIIDKIEFMFDMFHEFNDDVESE